MASLEIVKSEVGTVDDELVGEEVTPHYDEQDGKDNNSACSQLEWCDVIGDPLAKGGFRRECDIKLVSALVGRS
jgi:hypothetical protein